MVFMGTVLNSRSKFTGVLASAPHGPLHTASSRLVLQLLKRPNAKPRGIKSKRKNADWRYSYQVETFGNPMSLHLPCQDRPLRLRSAESRALE